MIYILVILIAMLSMAKRRPRRRWGANDANVSWLTSLALSTLLDQIVVKGTTLTASDRSYRLLSMRTTWGMRGGTAGEGPILVGYAHSDYTVTEIKEAVEAEGAMVTNDKIAQEQANRLVRVVGTFPGITEDEVLNDGRPIRTKLNWAIPLGGNVDVFAYNRSGATLTTGKVLVPNGYARVVFT